jgi:CRP/FNR family transcriptional regulator, anaerobic regulatory protein
VLTVVDRGDDKSSLKDRLTTAVPELADADEAILERLLENAQVVKLDHDRFVFHAGDLCQAFLILLDGEVRVQLTAENGREVTLYRIGPGGSCILTTSCLLSNEHYPAEAIAESDIEAIAIPVTSFQSALEGSQWFRRFVFDGFSSRLTSVIQKIEQIAFTGIDVRLAGVLLELDRKGIEKITHQDIAVELGTAREVVSRHLKRFESEGWVRLGRGQVSLIDRPRIEALAGPSFGD